MATEIRVPTLGESVTEATIGKWFKKVGDSVAADETLVELETDKVTVEVPAPAAGVLSEIAAKDGETVGVGAVLGSIDGAGGGARPGKKADVVWCQEEPKNMGAWSFIDPYLEWVLAHIDAKHQRVRYTGRPASASPATGLMSKHLQQLSSLLEDALGE